MVQVLISDFLKFSAVIPAFLSFNFRESSVPKVTSFLPAMFSIVKSDQPILILIFSVQGSLTQIGLFVPVVPVFPTVFHSFHSFIIVSSVLLVFIPPVWNLSISLILSAALLASSTSLSGIPFRSAVGIAFIASYISFTLRCHSASLRSIPLQRNSAIFVSTLCRSPLEFFKS